MSVLRVPVAQDISVTKLPFTRQFAYPPTSDVLTLSTAFVKMPCGSDGAAVTKQDL